MSEYERNTKESVAVDQSSSGSEEDNGEKYRYELDNEVI